MKNQSLTTYPKNIKFISDETEAAFQKEVIQGKEKTGEYKFTKAKVNKGVTFTMTMQQINKLISDNGILITNE